MGSHSILPDLTERYDGHNGLIAVFGVCDFTLTAVSYQRCHY